MQDGNEPCEPHYLEQLRLSLLPEPSNSTPALLTRALWSSPARGLLESLGCTAQGAHLSVPLCLNTTNSIGRATLGR